MTSRTPQLGKNIREDQNNMSSVDKQPDAGLVERLRDAAVGLHREVNDHLRLYTEAATAIQTLTEEMEGWQWAAEQLGENALDQFDMIQAAEARALTAETARDLLQEMYDQTAADKARALSELDVAETALVEARKAASAFLETWDWEVEAYSLPSPPATREMLQRATKTTKKYAEKLRAALLQSEAGKLGSSVSQSGYDGESAASAGAEPSAAGAK